MSDKLHTKRKIIICWKCDGTGEIENGTRIAPVQDPAIIDMINNMNITPNRDPGIVSISTEYDICDECKGTGRLIKTKKWSVFFEPFNIKEIHKNIRHKLNEKD
jgi:hypothetical protein